MRNSTAVSFLRLAWISARVFEGRLDHAVEALVVNAVGLHEFALGVAGLEGFFDGVGFEGGDTAATPLGLGEVADEVLLGDSFGVVLAVVAIEEFVEFLLAFSGEEEGFGGKEPVFEGILGGALFAFFGARSGGVVF